MFCLPIPRDTFQTSKPYVLIAIAAVDALLLAPIFSSAKLLVFSRYGFTPEHATLVTAITSIFLHVGIWHYLGNMWFFWIFGRKVEHVLGHLRFAVLYLLCGLGGQALHLAFNVHSAIPTLGASGAISGIAGTYFLLFPRDRFYLHLYLGYWKVKTIETTTRSAVGAWIGEQFLFGLLTSVSSFSSEAFWAHIGGFGMGVAAGLFYHSRVPVESRPVVQLTGSIDDDEKEKSSGLITLKLNG